MRQAVMNLPFHFHYSLDWTWKICLASFLFIVLSTATELNRLHGKENGEVLEKRKINILKSNSTLDDGIANSQSTTESSSRRANVSSLQRFAVIEMTGKERECLKTDRLCNFNSELFDSRDETVLSKTWKKGIPVTCPLPYSKANKECRIESPDLPVSDTDLNYVQLEIRRKIEKNETTLRSQRQIRQSVMGEMQHFMNYSLNGKVLDKRKILTMRVNVTIRHFVIALPNAEILIDNIIQPSKIDDRRVDKQQLNTYKLQLAFSNLKRRSSNNYKVTINVSATCNNYHVDSKSFIILNGKKERDVTKFEQAVLLEKVKATQFRIPRIKTELEHFQKGKNGFLRSKILNSFEFKGQKFQGTSTASSKLFKNKRRRIVTIIYKLNIPWRMGHNTIHEKTHSKFKTDRKQSILNSTMLKIKGIKEIVYNMTTKRPEEANELVKTNISEMSVMSMSQKVNMDKKGYGKTEKMTTVHAVEELVSFVQSEVINGSRKILGSSMPKNMDIDKHSKGTTLSPSQVTHLPIKINVLTESRKKLTNSVSQGMNRTLYGKTGIGVPVSTFQWQHGRPRGFKGSGKTLVSSKPQIMGKNTCDKHAKGYTHSLVEGMILSDNSKYLTRPRTNLSVALLQKTDSKGYTNGGEGTTVTIVLERPLPSESKDFTRPRTNTPGTTTQNINKIGLGKSGKGTTVSTVQTRPLSSKSNDFSRPRTNAPGTTTQKMYEKGNGKSGNITTVQGRALHTKSMNFTWPQTNLPRTTQQINKKGFGKSRKGTSVPTGQTRPLPSKSKDFNRPRTNSPGTTQQINKKGFGKSRKGPAVSTVQTKSLPSKSKNFTRLGINTLSKTTHDIYKIGYGKIGKGTTVTTVRRRPLPRNGKDFTQPRTNPSGTTTQKMYRKEYGKSEKYTTVTTVQRRPLPRKGKDFTRPRTKPPGTTTQKIYSKEHGKSEKSTTVTTVQRRPLPRKGKDFTLPRTNPPGTTTQKMYSKEHGKSEKSTTVTTVQRRPLPRNGKDFTRPRTNPPGTTTQKMYSKEHSKSEKYTTVTTVQRRPLPRNGKDFTRPRTNPPGTTTQKMYSKEHSKSEKYTTVTTVQRRLLPRKGKDFTRPRTKPPGTTTQKMYSKQHGKSEKSTTATTVQRWPLPKNGKGFTRSRTNQPGTTTQKMYSKEPGQSEKSTTATTVQRWPLPRNGKGFTRPRTNPPGTTQKSHRKQHGKSGKGTTVRPFLGLVLPVKSKTVIGHTKSHIATSQKVDGKVYSTIRKTSQKSYEVWFSPLESKNFAGPRKFTINVIPQKIEAEDEAPGNVNSSTDIAEISPFEITQYASGTTKSSIELEQGNIRNRTYSPDKFPPEKMFWNAKILKTTSPFPYGVISNDLNFRKLYVDNESVRFHTQQPYIRPRHHTRTPKRPTGTNKRINCNVNPNMCLLKKRKYAANGSNKLPRNALEKLRSTTMKPCDFIFSGILPDKSKRNTF